MVELLVVMGIATRDALLHAIDKEFVEVNKSHQRNENQSWKLNANNFFFQAVELLLEHEELIHKEGEPYVSRIS